MSGNIKRDPMLDLYIYENNQLLETLELVLIKIENAGRFHDEAIDEIFRIMHTIKGSSGMMMYDSLTKLAHSVEDMFFFLRENKVEKDASGNVIEIVLESTDFIKGEMIKVEEGNQPDGDPIALIDKCKNTVLELSNELGVSSKEKKKKKQSKKDKPKFYVSPAQNVNHVENKLHKIYIIFEEDIQMENIRAFAVVNGLKDFSEKIAHIPAELLDDESAAENIIKDGFIIFVKTENGVGKIEKALKEIIFIKNYSIKAFDDEELFNKLLQNQIKDIEDEDNEEYEENQESEEEIDIENSLVDKNEKVVPPVIVPNLKNSKSVENETGKAETNEVERKLKKTSHVGVISVNVGKLDSLMDLVGELVISGLMVTDGSNSSVKGSPKEEKFRKYAIQHKKIIGEVQDIAMSLRMIPIAATFTKMTRIIRDVSKKLDKKIELMIYGDETEIDKNIVENIFDPLIHLVRNAADHGIESNEERKKVGKSELAIIHLEARNVGGEVWIIVKDDGKGLDPIDIYNKGSENGLITKTYEEMTASEIFSYIFKPGFSTKQVVTEFSGRGVGLDVVIKNIEQVGGNVCVESKKGEGTSFIIKIPLTLAIIGGMIIKVGEGKYTVPTMSIRESFRPKKEDIIIDPDKNEMIMIRGECYPIVRLHSKFVQDTKIESFDEGILMLVESDKGAYCIFADELLGEQQVVVKTLPLWNQEKVNGISGCTLLGDGSISLIIDLNTLFNWDE